MQTRIDELILKHLGGELTPGEHLELTEFKNQSEENRQLVDDLTDPQHLFGAIQRSRSLNSEAALQKAKKELFQPKIAQARYYWIAAEVAAGLVIVLTLAWLYFSNSSDKKETYAQEERPSSPYHQATLTLGNGQVLKLNELEDGSLGDDQMLMKKDGQLIYPLNYKPNHTGMNTLQTSKGSYYTLRLPDGSTVWLNSASSIQYPNSFTGDKRIVTVQGEVYFEVAKNPSKPFIVKTTSGMEVYVTGTKFAVNAYHGDSTARTTLLEGSVKIKGTGYADSLRPGEQAIATVGRKFRKIKLENPEQRVEGWKANKFIWRQTDIKTIVEDLSHFYGYNISYKTKIPSTTYDLAFNLDRSDPLDTIFNMLSKGTGLNFKLEGKTTIVIYR